LPGSDSRGRIGALLLGALLCGGALAADAIAPFDCTQGVCGFNVLPNEPLNAPCVEMSALVAYTRAVMLVQCSAGGDSSDNQVYLFDRRGPAGAAFEVAGARFMRADALSEAASNGVPDRFAVLPFCTPPKPGPRGELLLLVKAARPQADAQPPACWRLLRARVAGRRLMLTAGNDPVLPATAAVRAQWRALVARLQPLLLRDAAERRKPP
jgi:hypothetical protein